MEQWGYWIADGFPKKTFWIFITFMTCLFFGGDQVHKQYKEVEKEVETMTIHGAVSSMKTAMQYVVPGVQPASSVVSTRMLI